jgi:hypothetical protein
MFDTFNGKIYYDNSKYKLVVVYYDEDGNTLRYYGWATTEPYNLNPSNGAQCRLQVTTIDGTSIDEATRNDLCNIVYVESEETSVLVETVSKFATVYVDGVNGSDDNNGTRDAPFATIQKGIDSGARIVYVAPGDYTGSVVISNRDDITIMPTTYNSSYSDEVPETQKIKISNGSFEVTDCGSVKVVGVHRDSTNGNNGFYMNRVKNIVCIDCVASNVTGTNRCGFGIISSNGTFTNCVAHNVALDGFNMHGYGNTDFYNCSAYDCGDDGISHHDGCTGSIIGGEWYRCGKGGVASPTYGADVTISNVYSHDNKYGLYAVSPGSTGRVSGCVFKNNTEHDLYIGAGTLTGWNNVYSTKYLGRDAVFNENKPEYVLIEDITLDEAVASFERNTAPDGSAYNFTDIRIAITTPAVETATAITLRAYHTGGGELLFFSINTSINTQAQTTIYKLYNDKGLVEFYGYTGRDTVSSANMQRRGYFWDTPWKNVGKIKLTASSIPAGTRIVIYAVRG